MKRNPYGYILDESPWEKEMRIKERILSQHCYQFTHLSTGYWQTYYRDPISGKRTCIKRKTREEVENVLVNLVKGGDKRFRTFGEVYLKEWLPYKAGITTSDNTVKRHKQIYAKYLAGTSLDKKRVVEIDGLFLNQFCNNLIKENHLKYKAYVGIKTIINGTFVYCLLKGYIEKNPMDLVVITVKFCQEEKKDQRKQVFNTGEMADLKGYLRNKQEETTDDSFLALEINAYLGLRVSELSALKWKDWNFTKVHIERAEVRNQMTNETYVEDHTKTYLVRDVHVPPQAMKILNDLRIAKGFPDGEEYMFQRNGERLRSRQMAYVLEKYAKCTGAIKKSSHKIRKTYASNLSAAGVPIDCIREELGHTSIKTTMGYLFNTLTEEETYEIIKKAFEKPDLGDEDDNSEMTQS